MLKRRRNVRHGLCLAFCVGLGRPVIARAWGRGWGRGASAVQCWRQIALQIQPASQPNQIRSYSDHSGALALALADALRYGHAVARVSWLGHVVVPVVEEPHPTPSLSRHNPFTPNG